MTTTTERQLPPWLSRPRLAEGVELIGEMRDTAYAVETRLIYRPDGQYIQATATLYRALELMDGERTLDEIAVELSKSLGEDVPLEDLTWLVRERIAAAGLLDTTGAEQLNEEDRPPELALRRMPPLAGLRWKLPIIPYTVAQPISGVLHHLFTPAIVALVLTTALAANLWVYLTQPVGGSITSAVENPYLVLMLTLLVFANSFWHEFGHASACYRGGVPHGSIGMGLFFVYPAFYADVTHAYRLSRMQRLRVDLGGLYFNVIAICIMIGIYVISDWEPLLITIAAWNVALVTQLNPLVRFDGYYVFADAIGVPDPLSAAVLYVKGLLPGERPRLKLRRSARFLFPIYVASIGIFVLVLATTSVLWLPEIVAELPDRYRILGEGLVDSWRSADPIIIVNNTLQIILLSAFPIGLTLIGIILSLRLLRLLRATALLLARASLRFTRPPEQVVVTVGAEPQSTDATAGPEHGDAGQDITAGDEPSRAVRP